MSNRQTWAECVTGIAGAAKLIYRGGKVRNGTLRCSRCGKPHQFALWSGNQCKACFDTHGDDELSSLGSHIVPENYYEQTQLTKSIKGRCKELCAEHNLTDKALCDALGITQYRYSKFINGVMGYIGQVNLAKEILDPLERLEQLLDSDPSRLCGQFRKLEAVA